MQILLQIHYISSGGKALQQGDFQVNAMNYKTDPDKEAVRVAYKWFKQIKRENINEIDLYRVFYNGIDITNLVKKL